VTHDDSAVDHWKRSMTPRTHLPWNNGIASSKERSVCKDEPWPMPTTWHDHHACSDLNVQIVCGLIEEQHVGLHRE